MFQLNKCNQRRNEDQTIGSTSSHKFANVLGAFPLGAFTAETAILTLSIFVNRNHSGALVLLDSSLASDAAVYSDPDQCSIAISLAHVCLPAARVWGPHFLIDSCQKALLSS